MALEQDMATLFKALGDENRIRILKLLRSSERCGCELLEELNISQPTLSHHIKVLCDVGILVGRKDGKRTCYSISCEGVCRVRRMMQGLLARENIPGHCANNGKCADCRRKLGDECPERGDLEING